MTDTAEIWAADVYTSSNMAQTRDGQELIAQILKDGIDNVEIIIDIGCGNGEMTKILSREVPHKKLYALDFDAQMVEFANKKFNDGTIEYFIQDIGVPWEKLDERLKNLENKVDIVFSNRVLHWVPDKLTAAKTIGRLLKPGGRCYINTTLERDINEFVTKEQKAENSKFVNFETNQEQFDYWKEHFNNCGLSKVNVQMLFKDWTYDTEDQYWGMASYVGPFIKNRIVPGIPEKDKESIVDMFKTPVYLGLQTKYGQKPAEIIIENNKIMYYEQFRIIGTK